MEPQTVELEREVAVQPGQSQELSEILAPFIAKRLRNTPEAQRTKALREAVMDEYIQELNRVRRDLYGHVPPNAKQSAVATDLMHAGLLTNLDEFTTYELAEGTLELLARHENQMRYY